MRGPETLRAVAALVALTGSALGGYNLMENTSEAPEAPRVVTPPPVAAAPALPAEPPLQWEPVPAPHDPAAVPVVDKSAAPLAPAEIGANAQASAEQSAATCECSCEEREGLGDKLVRFLPFLGFLPGL